MFFDVAILGVLSSRRHQRVQYNEHCPTIPTILNAKVGNIGTAIGHTVNYTCTIGYQFPDNTTAMNLTCLQNGEWSVATKDLPICDVVKCPELKKFSHQSMNTRNNTYNTTIIFWCDVGYALSDNTTARTIKCTETGKWSANLPPCEPIKCKHIKPVAKGYRNSSNNVFDTFVEYRCNSGFRMEDGAAWRIIKCDATGEWSDNVTDCALNRCYPLPYVANATPSTLVAELNTEVTFKCIQGHKFFTTKADTQTIICKSDNIRLRWTPNLKGCEPIQCPILSTEITNQNLKNLGPATEARLYGSVVAIKCHKGHYKPDNTSTEVVECLSTEKWNLTTYKECDPVKCLGPPAMDNGTHSRNTYSRTTFEYLNLVYYQCKSQHKFLDGRTTRNITCNEFGKWNESDLSCRKDRCDPIPLLANVKPNTTQTNWYTVVKYTCQDGFEWTQGTKQVIVDCTDTGVWNNENALKPCTAKVCPTMPTQTNSSHNGTKTPTTYVYGDYVEHRCDTGYIYKKNKAKAMVMNCNSQGKWEPATLDKCEPIVCGELDQIDNATLQTNDTHFGIDIVYKCNDGYQFPDKDREKTVRCQAGENDTVGHYEWFKFKTQNPAKMANHCEVVFCPPVPAWTEREFNSTENEFTSVVMYWCKDKYTFETCDSAKDNYANCEKATKLITTVEETVLEMTTAAGNDSGGGGLTTKTVKRTESTCVEAKVWDPPFLDCVPIKSIGEGVKGVVTESKDGPTFGIFAISLLVVTGITLVLLDLNKLWTDIQLMRKNIKDFMNKRKKNKVTDSSVSIPDSTA